MDVVKICVVCIILGVIIVYLRSVNKELSMLALVCASGVMLLIITDAVANVFSVYQKLYEISGVSSDVLRLIIKITLICYIVEFSVGAIEDFGLKSLADKLGIVGKIVVLLMATPIVENLINVIVTLLS